MSVNLRLWANVTWFRSYRVRRVEISRTLQCMCSINFGFVQRNGIFVSVFDSTKLLNCMGMRLGFPALPWIPCRASITLNSALPCDCFCDVTAMSAASEVLRSEMCCCSVLFCSVLDTPLLLKVSRLTKRYIFETTFHINFSKDVTANLVNS